jgi:putative hydrolase of the HAD superfamily
LDCQAADFLMIGNSLKSDVLPVLNIGGHAIHIPYHTTWEYEQIDFEVEHENFHAFEKITDVLQLL